MLFFLWEFHTTCHDQIHTIPPTLPVFIYLFPDQPLHSLLVYFFKTSLCCPCIRCVVLHTNVLNYLIIQSSTLSDVNSCLQFWVGVEFCAQVPFLCWDLVCIGLALGLHTCHNHCEITGAAALLIIYHSVQLSFNKTSSLWPLDNVFTSKVFHEEQAYLKFQS